MIIAQLRIHHSRQPSATRRVAPEPLRLVTIDGSEAAQFLCAGVVGWNVPLLDDEDRDSLDVLFAELEAQERPSRALRHRVQKDHIGLDLSVHTLYAGRTGWRLQLDDHGPPAPQVVGALVALESLHDVHRRSGLEFARVAVDFPGGTVEDLEAFLRGKLAPEQRRVVERGVRAWALHLLGFDLTLRTPSIDDVVRAYRQQMREAHPDHGAPHEGAADRMDALRRARRILTGSD